MTTGLIAEDLAIGHAGSSALLEGVDFRVDPGVLIALLGRNGSGKSTLLATLAGLLPALSGRLLLDGAPLANLTATARARAIAVVRPGRAALGGLRVEEFVGMGRLPHTDWWGTLRDADHERVEAALRAVDADAFTERQLNTLSDGEYQRVSLARALAQEPTLLLLDEPTAFLDLPGRREIMRLLADLAHDETGRTVILAIHDLDLALRYADRLWVIDNGALIRGQPASLQDQGVLAAAFGVEDERQTLA
ncbi:MAG: ABC transporter ATP-binding protein [Acidobacteriota bacterium]